MTDWTEIDSSPNEPLWLVHRTVWGESWQLRSWPGGYDGELDGWIERDGDAFRIMGAGEETNYSDLETAIRELLRRNRDLCLKQTIERITAEITETFHHWQVTPFVNVEEA